MDTSEEKKPESLAAKEGAFASALVRNNQQIREDRAITITEAAEMLYKRQVEDIEFELKQLRRDRDAMLDLSPTDANSLVLASDFDAKRFVEKDIQLGISIRNLEIKLKIASERYTYLFK